MNLRDTYDTRLMEFGKNASTTPTGENVASGYHGGCPFFPLNAHPTRMRPLLNSNKKMIFAISALLLTSVTGMFNYMQCESIFISKYL